ncbi:MAG TPA: hypothetical protein VFK07_03205 [Candidatus Paceibacterota bacterium]|nr:hypothetical protein [Candidatus Paceibacterota bacterium]
MIWVFTWVISAQRYAPTQDSAEPAPLTVCRSLRGQANMCLAENDTSQLKDRIPVLFIHGWNRQSIPAPPDTKSLANLEKYLKKIVWVSDDFKFYTVSYWSNATDLRSMGKVLNELVSDMDGKDRDFRKQKLVIVAHSMGGLIARSFTEENVLHGAPAGKRVRRIVTLATPHHGTPAANGPARDAKAGPFVGTIIKDFDAGLFNQNLTWSTDDRYEMHWDNYDGLLDYQRFPSEANTWLDHLNRYGHYQKLVSAYGGVFEPSKGANHCLTPDYDCYATIFKLVLGVDKTDGVVPFASASFDKCRGCITHEPLNGYNHSQMASGLKKSDSNLFGLVAGDLSDLVSKRDSRFDSAVFFGDKNDEPFHNLRNWGKVQKSNFGQGYDRAVPTTGLSSVDLFVQPPRHPNQDLQADKAPLGEYDLLVEYDEQTCRSQYTAYVNGDMVGAFSHGVGRGDNGVMLFVIPVKDIKSRRVTVSFESNMSPCLPLVKAVEISVRGQP